MLHVYLTIKDNSCILKTLGDNIEENLPIIDS